MSISDNPPLHDFPDRSIRDALQHRHNLRDLLMDIAPDLASKLDWEEVTQPPREFLLDDWRGREADLLFRIPFRPESGTGEVFVCLLLEHQSRPDPRMPLRLLLYATLHWERQWKAWEDKHSEGESLQLTPILPVVFHTGPKPWTGNRTLADMFAGPPELRELAPQWPVRFWDLSARTPDELIGAEGDFLKVMARVRAGRDELTTFRAILHRAVQMLEPLADQDKMRWRSLLKFAVSWVHYRRSSEECKPLVADVVAAQQELIHREEVKAMSETMEMSWAEEMEQKLERKLRQTLLDEGRDKGRTEGQLIALRETLTSLFAERFGTVPEDLAKRIADCSDIQRFKKAILQVSHISSSDELQL